eukprot:6065561-Amphidinium_carterae.1
MKVCSMCWRTGVGWWPSCTMPVHDVSPKDAKDIPHASLTTGTAGLVQPPRQYRYIVITSLTHACQFGKKLAQLHWKLDYLRIAYDTMQAFWF